MQALKTEFLGQEVTLVKNKGVAYVAMREIVLALGFDWWGEHRHLIEQTQKLKLLYIPATGKDGNKYEMVCIPINKLTVWLLSLNPKKVRADLKERLENYQKEWFLALWSPEASEKVREGVPE